MANNLSTTAVNRDENAERYAFSIKWSSVATIRYDNQANVTLVNDTFCSLIGYTRSQLLTMNIVDIDKNYSQTQIENMLLNGEGARLESTLTRKDGSVIPVEVLSQAHLDEEEKYFSALILDISERVATKQELQKTKLAVDHSAEAVIWYRRDASHMYVNEHVCSWLGYTRDELLSMKCNEITPTMTKETASSLFEKCILDGSLKFESTKQHKNGTLFPVEIVANHHKVNGEEFFCTFIRDISDRKTAEKQLRLNQLGIENSLDAVFWIQADGSFSYVNKTACDNLGYTRDELLQLNVYDISLHCHSPNIWHDTWNQTTDKRSLRLEAQYRRKDGSLYDCEIRMNYLNFQGDEIIHSTVRDITESKNAQARLRQQSLSLDRASAAIAWAEMETGVIIDVNETLCQRLGYEKREMIGKSFAEFDNVAKDLEKCAQIEDDLEQTGKAKFESVLTRSDGTEIPVEQTVTVHDFDGEPLVCCFMRDITEQKKDKQETEQQLANLSAQLAHLDRVSSMGEMASAIAHELNQPLAVISTNAFLLEQQLNSDQPPIIDPAKVAAEISEQAIMSGEIVHRLRGFVSGSKQVRELADVNEIAVESLKLMDTRIRHSNIEQQSHLAEQLPNIDVDRIQIQQVIVNLLLNAVEAIQDNRKSQNRIAVRTSLPSHESVQIEIEDTGEGVSADDANVLFDPFFTTKSNGMGMGLAISRSIIEGHGGTIDCTSSQHGTVFRIRLPLPNPKLD